MTDKHAIFGYQFYPGSWQGAVQVDDSGSYLLDRDPNSLFKRN